MLVAMVVSHSSSGPGLVPLAPLGFAVPAGGHGAGGVSAFGRLWTSGVLEATTAGLRDREVDCQRSEARWGCRDLRSPELIECAVSMENRRNLPSRSTV